MKMTEWAKREVEIACKKENPNRIGRVWIVKTAAKLVLYRGGIICGEIFDIQKRFMSLIQR